MKFFTKYMLIAMLLLPLLYSCATYNKSMTGYYANIKAKDYAKAQRSLEGNKLINKNRNALLLNAEMGKLMRLQNNFEKSNIYFNRADALIENNNKTFADVALGNLINPMQQTYLGEDYEQFMLHYYKALNYISLGKMEDAVVEARRITLANNNLNNKVVNKNNKYSNDAFALNLQGMIYESAGDINNAFIAYRNAAEVYIKANNNYYGVQLPLQLQNDVVRTATMMGFTADVQQFKTLFTANYTLPDTNKTELILFVEEGQAPIKKEHNFFLTAGKNGINSFNYLDTNGSNNNFNFNYNDYGINADKLTDIRGFRLALPVYEVQDNTPQNTIVQLNGITYNTQLAQNVNSIAVATLKERFLKEMGNALARQITKKIAEKGTEAIAESIAKNTGKKQPTDTTEAAKVELQKQHNDKAKRVGDAAGFALNLLNNITEKADTRNWQSLPAFISYIRIPLLQGQNTIAILTNAGKQKTLQVNGSRGLQMMSVVVE